MRMTLQIKWTHLWMIPLLIMACSMLVAAAPYDLKLDYVTMYCQEGFDRCGAACAQMAHDGYPSPPNPAFFLQSNLWSVLQANKNDFNIPWYTDPDGLMYCLNDMNHPPGGQWIVLSDTVYESEMFDILYWMAKLGYPTPVLIEENHWVAVYGFETDVDPMMPGVKPALKYIRFYNPDPVCYGYTNQAGVSHGGVKRVIAGDKWAAAYFLPFSTPVNTALLSYDPSNSKWHNAFLAVLEPPVVRGQIAPADEIARTGTPISPGQAIDAARAALDEVNLCEDEEFSILCEFPMLEPVGLVNHEFRGELWPEREYGGHYLVPIGESVSTDEFAQFAQGVPLSGSDETLRVMYGAIIVNAYTGEFEEACVFEPTPYLTMEQAIALSETVLEGAAILEEPTLVYEFSEQTRNSCFPLWRIVSVDRRVFYVDRFGRVFDQLTADRPG